MGNEIDLSRLLGTLWRGKIWILLLGIVSLFIGGWYAFTVATPIYTANTTVVLESREQNVLDIDSVVAGLSGDQSSINTEVEVFRSRILIERLVRDLNLVENPEFNRSLQEPPKISVGIVVNAIRSFISGPISPRPAPSERAIMDTVIDATLRKITVASLPSSYVFRIRVQSERSRTSAEIANRLAELYIDDQIRVKFEKTEQATTWLSERVTELQATLEDAEEGLKSFSSKTDFVSTSGLVALNRQLKEFRDRHDGLQLSNELQTQKLQQLQDAFQNASYTAFETLADDRVFTQILSRSGLSEAERLKVLEREAQRILDKNQQSVDRTGSQLAAVAGSILEVNTRIERQSKELVKMQQLEREIQASRLIYEAFLSRLKETSIQQGIQQADSRILSRAVVPIRPTTPRKSRILVLSLFLGLVVGSAAVLLREASQNTFRTSQDLEELTKVSVLGQIPAIPARKRSNVIKYLKDKPNSGAAEAIRNLRTSVLLANVDKNPQIIMSTSSVPGEGKTTQSIALTQNFAGMGEKVLLLECDIRRRVFKDYFEIKSDKGFVSVLSDDLTLDDVIIESKLLNADILPGENSSVNAADLFSSEKFTSMLKELRKKYDRIIIDTPPVLAVPDARVVGQSVDAIIYTVKWDSTTHIQVLEGLKSLESVNLKVSGLVLGQINKRGMQRYGYGGGYGSYQGYYNN